MSEPEYLTLKEWFTLMRVSERTARQLVADGKIPGAFRLGGQWRIPATLCNRESNPPLRAAKA